MTLLTIIWAFIVAHWADILVVILAVAAAGIAWRMGYKKEVKKVILSLVAKAEVELGGTTGPIKYARVRAWIYAGIPSILKIFITEAMIGELIEYGFNELEKFLKDGGNLLTYVEEVDRIK